MNRFGPDNFSTLQMKGHVLHRARADYSNALLTKKLATFLSRLNEISGGCEKISFTFTFHPHNHALKSIILKNF